MGNLVLKNVPSTIALDEINLENLSSIDREAVLETIEFLEDYLYVSNRDNSEFVNEKEITDLISKYK